MANTTGGDGRALTVAGADEEPQCLYNFAAAAVQEGALLAREAASEGALLPIPLEATGSFWRIASFAFFSDRAEDRPPYLRSHVFTDGRPVPAIPGRLRLQSGGGRVVNLEVGLPTLGAFFQSRIGAGVTGPDASCLITIFINPAPGETVGTVGYDFTCSGMPTIAGLTSLLGLAPFLGLPQTAWAVAREIVSSGQYETALLGEGLVEKNDPFEIRSRATTYAQEGEPLISVRTLPPIGDRREQLSVALRQRWRYPLSPRNPFPLVPRLSSMLWEGAIQLSGNAPV